jgi:Ni/Co efflux regulator RcnB
MKRLFACAAALGLFVCVPAAAQNDDHHGDRNNAAASHAERGAPQAGANRGGQGHAQSGANRQNSGVTHQNANSGNAAGQSRTGSFGTRTNTPAAANNSGNRYLPTSGDVRSNQQGRATAGRAQNNPGRSGNAANQQQTFQSRQGNAAGQRNTVNQQPASNSRQGNAAQHANINSLRRNIQSPQHFRGGNYRAPQGYEQRHWGYGERLPRGYYTRDYWITDFLMFGLFAPPTDLIWVRVGDDALLIDRYSGDIVQVRYGVFY